MVTYDTNWMGPINIDWYKERGLVEDVWKTVETEEQARIHRLDIGEKYLTPQITIHAGAGRIDIRDSSKRGYDGWDEYSLAPMHGEDWNALTDFLMTLETETVLPYKQLINLFETHYGKKIRWME